MIYKVSVNLMGGLGNNLFQISCAYAYSLKNKKELFLNNKKSGIVHGSLDSYKSNILKNINFSSEQMKNFKVYSEPFFNYNEIPFIDGNLLIQTYFQSEKYFKEYETEIRKLFLYSCDLSSSLNNILNNNITCSIHVRRGDYLNYPNAHPTQNVAYYMKALKKIPNECVCLVFSDDIKWCKENFPEIEGKFVFIEGNKDYEDLFLMSQCNHNIIANSSFSWWGAWLNKNENKIVVAPSKWFGVGSNYNTKDLYCNNWIKI